MCLGSPLLSRRKRRASAPQTFASSAFDSFREIRIRDYYFWGPALVSVLVSVLGSVQTKFSTDRVSPKHGGDPVAFSAPFSSSLAAAKIQFEETSKPTLFARPASPLPLCALSPLPMGCVRRNAESVRRFVKRPSIEQSMFLKTGVNRPLFSQQLVF